MFLGETFGISTGSGAWLKMPTVKLDAGSSASASADWSSVLSSAIGAFGQIGTGIIGAASAAGTQKRQLELSKIGQVGAAVTSYLPILAIAGIGVAAVLLLRR